MRCTRAALMLYVSACLLACEWKLAVVNFFCVMWFEVVSPWFLTLVHVALASPVNKGTSTTNVHAQTLTYARVFVSISNMPASYPVSCGMRRAVCLLARAGTLSRHQPSLLRSERPLEHISFSVITQQKLVWQPVSSSNMWRWTMRNAWASLPVHCCHVQRPVAFMIID